MEHLRRFGRLVTRGPYDPTTAFMRTLPWLAHHRPVSRIRPLARGLAWLGEATRGWWLLIDWFLCVALMIPLFIVYIHGTLDGQVLWFLAGTLLLALSTQLAVNREWMSLSVGLFGLIVGDLVLYGPLLLAYNGWFRIAPATQQSVLRAVVSTTCLFIVGGIVKEGWAAYRRARTRRHYGQPRFDRRKRDRRRNPPPPPIRE